jgi:hypothetical protein
MISSNASRVLCDMGLRESLDHVGIHMRRVVFMKHDDGTVLSDTRYSDDVEEKLGAPLWQIHRADLHDVLLAKAREIGVEIEMGVKVERFDWDAPSALMEGGTVAKADVILVADGKYICPPSAKKDDLYHVKDIAQVLEESCLVSTRSHGSVATLRTGHLSTVLNSRMIPC